MNGYNGYNSGGKGAYAKGTINLTANTDKLYIYVGGKNGYNGGGTGYSPNGVGPTNGGGATDIRVNGTGLNNRVIVAGGGGGPSIFVDEDSIFNSRSGGAGGVQGEPFYSPDSYKIGNTEGGKCNWLAGGAGSDVAGGTAGGISRPSGTNFLVYSFGSEGSKGKGGDSTEYNWLRIAYMYSGAGGGGWYGGGSGSASVLTIDANWVYLVPTSGGGGSSFVLTTTNRPSNYTVPVQYNMINSEIKNGDQYMDVPDGEDTYKKSWGKENNGHVRIKYLGQ